MPETSITRAAAPGPIAVAGYLQRDLVEARGWVSKQDFLDVWHPLTRAVLARAPRLGCNHGFIDGPALRARGERVGTR